MAVISIAGVSIISSKIEDGTAALWGGKIYRKCAHIEMHKHGYASIRMIVHRFFYQRAFVGGDPMPPPPEGLRGPTPPRPPPTPRAPPARRSTRRPPCPPPTSSPPSRPRPSQRSRSGIGSGILPFVHILEASEYFTGRLKSLLLVIQPLAKHSGTFMCLLYLVPQPPPLPRGHR